MDLIRTYIRNIVMYMIFDAFVVIIFPGDKYKKYISLVSGFILILIMLTPTKNLICYFNKRIDWFTGYKTKDSDNKSIAEAYIDSIKKQVRNIANNIGFEIKQVDIKINNNSDRYQIDSLKIKLADNSIDDNYKKKFMSTISLFYNLENKNIIFD